MVYRRFNHAVNNTNYNNSRLIANEINKVKKFIYASRGFRNVSPDSYKIAEWIRKKKEFHGLENITKNDIQSWMNEDRLSKVDLKSELGSVVTPEKIDASSEGLTKKRNQVSSEISDEMAKKQTLDIQNRLSNRLGVTPENPNMTISDVFQNITLSLNSHGFEEGDSTRATLYNQPSVECRGPGK